MSHTGRRFWYVRSLRFHGIAGLRIADSSVMPTITSGNSNTPTAMIAEKAAAMIVQGARR